VISLASDEGKPAILAAPESAQARAFREIARQLAAQISTLYFFSQAETP
jgi:MinD-like ATPase involved in chromosome partitioning or flagellar assembly